MTCAFRHLLPTLIGIALWIGTVYGQPPVRNTFGNPPPETFESPDRDEWQRPEWVIDQLDLRPTDVVADIGVGSGYFSRRIARRLSEGRVIAVDIDPEMLTYMKESAERDDIHNIEARLVEPGDHGLDRASVDVIFLSNTLHHIHDRPAYYPRLVSALRPGGRIVNIDFYKRDLPVGPRDLDHKLSKAAVLDEFGAANLFVSKDHEGLPHQYFLEGAPLPSIPNAVVLNAQTVCAGKPSVGQLEELARLGFRTVINLQTKAEGADAEGKQVERLKMGYVNIPIASHEITDEQIAQFSRILTQNDRYPMLIHCRSANRVGAMLLLHQVVSMDKDLETSLIEARRAGLKQPLEERLLQRMTAER